MTTNWQKLNDVWREAQPFANPRTVSTYVRQFLKYDKFNNGLCISLPSFQPRPLGLSHIKDFLKTIENNNTKANYLAMFCNVYKHFTDDKETLEKLRDMVIEIKTTIQLNLDEHKKTEVQDKNWNIA